jgi:hypothetical protein
LLIGCWRPGIYICAGEAPANVGIDLYGLIMPFFSSYILGSSVEVLFPSNAFETDNQVYIKGIIIEKICT